MKKLVVSLISASALATVGMAAAANSMAASTNNGAGIFVSGNLGYGASGFSKGQYQAIYNNVAVQSTSGSGTFYTSPVTAYSDGDFAWAANLGYQFNRYLAIEAGYISFGQSKASDNVTLKKNTRSYDGVVTYKNTFGGFDAAVKGILPVSTQFDLFGKIGAVDMHQKEVINTPEAIHFGYGSQTISTTKWTPLLGVGTSFNVNSNIALNLQDDYALKSGSNMPSANAVLAGASYKFNM